MLQYKVQCEISVPISRGPLSLIRSVVISLVLPFIISSSSASCRGCGSLSVQPYQLQTLFQFTCRFVGGIKKKKKLIGYVSTLQRTCSVWAVFPAELRITNMRTSTCFYKIKLWQAESRWTLAYWKIIRGPYFKPPVYGFGQNVACSI